MGHMHAPEFAATTSYHREPATPLLGSYLVEKATAGCKIDRFECCAGGGEGCAPQRVVKSRSDGGKTGGANRFLRMSDITRLKRKNISQP